MTNDLARHDASQNGEALWLYNYCCEKFYGFEELKDDFLDVGAIDGVRNSNSYLFKHLGWNITYLEPNPFTFRDLLNNFLHQNCKCRFLNVAAGYGHKIQPFKPVHKQGFLGHSKIDVNGELDVVQIPVSELYLTPHL